MKLKGKVIGDLNGVEEAYRGLYVPLVKDGKEVLTADGKKIFVLDVEDMEHKDDITGLKNALETERAQSTERQGKITAHEATIAKLNSDLEAAKKSGKSKEGDESAIEAIKKELTDRHKVELDQARAQGESYRSALDKAMRTDVARAAISNAKGSADLLLPHVLDRTQFVEEKDAEGKPTGQFKVVVVNEKGAPRIGDSQGNPMTLDQLVAEMKSNESFGRAFEPEGKGGTGSQTGSTASTGTVTSKKDFKSSSEKAAFIRENGSEKYLELPD